MELRDELLLMLGRLNAVHAGLLVIARSLPRETASVAASQMRRSAEAVHANALATPVRDAVLDEQHRVILELAAVLQAAADQSP